MLALISKPEGDEVAPSGHVGSPNLVSPDTPTQMRRKLLEEEESKRIQERLLSHGGSMDDGEDRCLICMSGFSKRLPKYRIPCSNKCSESTVVHEKCIYEWKERQEGTGSCPLCRAPLEHMTYVPPDALRSSTFHIMACRSYFITHPVDPRVGMIRCYIRGRSSGFSEAPARFVYSFFQAATKSRGGKAKAKAVSDLILSMLESRLESWSSILHLFFFLEGIKFLYYTTHF